MNKLVAFITALAFLVFATALTLAAAVNYERSVGIARSEIWQVQSHSASSATVAITDGDEEIRDHCSETLSVLSATPKQR